MKAVESLAASQIVGLFISLQIVPLIALHVNYFLTNKGDILEFDEQSKVFYFHHRDKTVQFHLNDIKNVTYFKSFPLAKKHLALLAWDNYHHAVIVLNSNIQIVVTSLMTGFELRLQIPSEKSLTKMNFYRWVTNESFKNNLLN